MSYYYYSFVSLFSLTLFISLNKRGEKEDSPPCENKDKDKDKQTKKALKSNNFTKCYISQLKEEEEEGIE